MSLAHRLPDAVPGTTPDRPVLFTLGVPELRAQRRAVRARRRAHRLMIARLVICSCLFLLGVAAGLLTANALTGAGPRPVAAPALASQPESGVVTIRTLPHP